ncbi:MAG: elongation factor P, partial [Bacteroidales bacterium]|nr:elongation factor P [Bacteroidales bacterium]
MATTADFKNGLCIVYNNELWTIVEFQHVKPGKGNTFVRTKLKHIKSGRVQEVRF